MAVAQRGWTARALQRQAATQSAATTSATPSIACSRAGSRQDPASTDPRWSHRPVRISGLKPPVTTMIQFWNQQVTTLHQQLEARAHNGVTVRQLCRAELLGLLPETDSFVS